MSLLLEGSIESCCLVLAGLHSMANASIFTVSSATFPPGSINCTSFVPSILSVCCNFCTVFLLSSSGPNSLLSELSTQTARSLSQSSAECLCFFFRCDHLFLEGRFLLLAGGSTLHTIAFLSAFPATSTLICNSDDGISTAPLEAGTLLPNSSGTGDTCG